MAESIALLIALQTTAENFGARRARSHYLSRFAENGWAAYARSVGAPLAELAKAARALDIYVDDEPPLAALGAATARFNVVILLSHWKGPQIGNDDLLSPDPQAYVMRTSDSGAAQWVAERFKRRPPKTRGDVRDVLNEFVTTQNALSQPGGNTVAASAFTIMSANRAALDAEFAGLLQPGNQVEFADGMHGVDAVADAVAPHFGGLIDLTTCTSTFLSDRLSRAARGRYFTVQFDAEQEPDISCLLLERTFALAAGTMDYRSARRRAHAEFSAAIEANAAKRSGWGGLFGARRKHK